MLEAPAAMRNEPGMRLTKKKRGPKASFHRYFTTMPGCSVIRNYS